MIIRQGPKIKPLLADQLQASSCLHSDRGWKTAGQMAKEIRQYERVVLDDDATKLICQTAHAEPKIIAKMTELCVSPYDKLWVEMSYSVMDQEIRSQTSNGLSREVHPDERIAFVFENLDGAVQVRCVQHVDGNPKKVHEWPVAFLISNTGDELDRKNMQRYAHDSAEKILVFPGYDDDLLQTGYFWGYEKSFPGLDKLTWKGETMVLSHIEKGMWDFNVDMPHIVNLAARELRGMPRRAVATLALLNTTIVQIADRTRPPGRFLVGGSQPKPFLSRTTAVLNVPHRVRYIREYVEKEIRDEVNRIRKRRHKVKGHFRHLPYEPLNGDGWVPCFCPGREPGKYWHRHIHEHERGDESLGYVDHPYTVARGAPEGVEP